MRIGKIEKNEPSIRFKLNLVCIDCGIKVPGGMLTSKSYFGTYSFMLEIDSLKKTYMCGKCRDKKRLSKI